MTESTDRREMERFIINYYIKLSSRRHNIILRTLVHLCIFHIFYLILVFENFIRISYRYNIINTYKYQWSHSRKSKVHTSHSHKYTPPQILTCIRSSYHSSCIRYYYVSLSIANGCVQHYHKHSYQPTVA